MSEVDHDVGLMSFERATEIGFDGNVERFTTDELSDVGSRDRVDGADELKLGIVEHRSDDRQAHSPMCAANQYFDQYIRLRFCANPFYR